MDAPKQYGSLGNFVMWVSDLDDTLRIYALEPWTARSPAIATPGSLRPVNRSLDPRAAERERIAAVFGDADADRDPAARRPDPNANPNANPFANLDGFTLFFDVDALQPIVRKLRRAGIKDETRLCQEVIARALAR